MNSSWSSIDRRTVLRLGLTVGALGVFGGAIANAAVQAPLPGAVVAPSAAAGGDLEPELRYLFACSDVQRLLGQFTSLEEVWAYSAYMRIASCQVTYIGQGTHSLTLEESAIVQVAEDAGMVVEDRPATYRTILATCTRIPPGLLETRLAQLGVPVVKAALALAPEAPQSKLLSEWLVRAS